MKNKLKFVIRHSFARPTFGFVIAAVLCASVAPARAQLTATYSSNLLTAPVVCQTASSNLAAGQYNTNRLWQGKNLGIGMAFAGGSATNTGTVGFQFGVQIHGVNGQLSTTRPFTITSTANGTTPVVDWGVLPSYTVGPADCLVLLGITNAAVNVNPAAAGSVTISNVWLQMDTRP